MLPTLIALGAVLLIGLIWLIATYNRFVRLRQHMRESWSDIDVELKRRYELIPNLVATVKGYARHEKEIFERVAELRNSAAANHGSPSSQAADESMLMLEMKRLFVVVEAYPDLKADQRFLSLQKELALTEDRIAAARRFFNGNVRDLNTLAQAFPSNLIASTFGFEKSDYFELDSAAEGIVPKVEI